ncbi:MAG: O-methyltransferase [Bacilli bacterium]|nr:O-methyltransferase [Bacilli bacterium]
MNITNLKNKARKNNIPIIQDGGIAFIKKYITDNNIKTILEIGSAVGYSAISFALLDKNIKVHTLERDVERYNEAIKNINEFNLNNQIIIKNVDALEYELDDTFDLIFIDAAKSQYIKFFEKYKHNLTTNGVIITDNLSFHGMVDDLSLTHNRNTKQLVGKIRNYIEFLKNNEEFDTVFYKDGDGISVSKKKN